jgi:inosose dehydratase
VRCEGTEIGIKYPTNPNILKEEMELRGLRMASQWRSTNLYTEGYEQNEKVFFK